MPYVNPRTLAARHGFEPLIWGQWDGDQETYMVRLDSGEIVVANDLTSLLRSLPHCPTDPIHA